MLGSTRIRKKPAKQRKLAAKPRLAPKKKPTQARSRETYEALLDAAARLLERHGYAALTTNHVAEAAGVAIGSLYEYFGTKEVIVAEVVRRAVQEVSHEIAGSFVQALSEGMQVGLPRLIRAMFAAIEARSKLMRVLWTEVPFLWDLDEIRALPEQLFAIARQGIPGATSGWLRHDPESATYLLTVMVRAAVIESVVARPSHLSSAALEVSLVKLLEHVLLTGAAGFCQQGQAVG
jgi:AcrR family transcriptional regulator